MLLYNRRRAREGAVFRHQHTMRIAIISDIHSNIDALNAVLKDIKSRAIEEVFSTGDLVGYLPYPNEVINTFVANDVQSIQGNHDLAIVEAPPVDKKSLATLTPLDLQKSASRVYTLTTISEENKAYLEALPETIEIEMDGVMIALVHGSPDRNDEYLYEDSERLEAIAKTMVADVLVFGHTHVPFHKVVNKKHFVNAGSVGKPKHGNPNSTYVIIETQDGKVQVEVVEVPYDAAPICKKIIEEPYIADNLAEALRLGQ